MSESENDEGLEASVIEHMRHVAHRVAAKLAELSPPEVRAHALEVAEKVLLDDEGARELLAAAFDEGRAEALVAARAGGEAPALDWSDIESPGERRAIRNEEHACNSCMHARVCTIDHATRAVGRLVVISRCETYSQQ